jgi:hypothetical protein
MPTGRVSAPFGDGEHEFRLTIGGLEELQEKCDAGPEFILQTLNNGSWRIAYIRETIRLGLIGGGMAPTEALVLRNRYAGDGQLLENKPLAAIILGAALMGSPEEDEAPGEPEGETNRSPVENGGSETSTRSAGS